MRILKLTAAVERQLLRARQTRNAQAERVAAAIAGDVQRRGDAALFAWTKKLDGVELRREGVWISRREIQAAKRSTSTEFLRAIRHAARNVRCVAERQMPRAWSLQVEAGVRVAQRVQPVETIGCYIPGGRHALVSTLVMTATPARVAGVGRVIAACPRPSTELLAAADALGVREMARIGGAQAIGAMAYGTESIPRVEKIFGPGNRFVTAAKQLVSADCAIDLPAGPTEAVVLADRGNPEWIAADLLAQAEHAPDALSFLVTTSLPLARAVQAAVAAQRQELDPANAARRSTRRVGAILLAASVTAAREFVHRFAPEHLSLPDASRDLRQGVVSAGTIFAGAYAAQPLGDYCSGSNHVLPTGGWARRRGGLSTADFVRCSTVQSISRQGFNRLAADAQLFARVEGLAAHANAVEVRR